MTLFGKAPKESPKEEQVPFGAGKLPTEQGQQSSSFGKGQTSSQFGKSLAPSRPAPPPARIEPKKNSPPTQKSSLSQKPAPAPKPTTFFGEKKDWRRQEFIGRVAKNPFSSGGKIYSFYERKKMLEKTFSPGRFSTYISEGEAKTRLRELRREEYRAKSGTDKLKISQTRKYLEKQTGLQGKY